MPVNYIEQKKNNKKTEFNKELRRIEIKFLHAVYSVKFIKDTLHFAQIQRQKRRIGYTKMAI